MLQITSQEDYLQFHSQENLKKNLSFKFAQRSNLIDIYIGHDQSLFPGQEILAKFFPPVTTPSENCFQVLPSISADIDPPNFPCQHVSYFIFALLPPSSAGEEIYIRVPDCKKGKKVHEKVFGSRPANIVHSNLFPLYFPPLFYLSFDLLVLSSSC